jgi:hypothetical protein
VLQVLVWLGFSSNALNCPHSDRALFYEDEEIS